jgi:hypothetical protein|uniref:Uncharacterized protein n=1 Tax=viral metagenome TaxID=1070528 RepID=A0A6C0LPV9_9ZZZZ
MSTESDISTNLGQLYKNLNNQVINTNDVILKQQDVINIVDAEKQRLLLKKQTVDDSLQQQKRLIQLNNSYRLRYTDYIKIMLFITFVIVLFVGIVLAQRYLPFIPSIVFEVMLILLIPISIIIMYYRFRNLMVHNNMNYEEIDYKPPTILSAEEKLAAQVKARETQQSSGDLLGGLSGCIGKDCCGETTQWDSGNSMCVTATNGFTTIDYAVINGDMNVSGLKIVNDSIKPNSPNEFKDYAKY